MLVAKILFNSVARFMIIAILIFYLNTPMAQPEYMQIKLGNIHNKTIKEYNCEARVINGIVNVEVNKGKPVVT